MFSGQEIDDHLHPHHWWEFVKMMVPWAVAVATIVGILYGIKRKKR